MYVVRSKLEVPFQLARVGIQRQQAIGIKIVAGADFAIPIGPRVTGAPVNQVSVGVVSASNPGGGGAILITLAGPGFGLRIARRRHRPEAPGLLASLRVVGVQKATDAVLATGDADDDLIFQRQRRHGNGLAGLIVGHHDIPAHDAGFGI